MKTEDLTALGLTEEQVDKVFALHGKAINAQKQKTTAAEAERDNYKTQLDAANDTLKKFEGIDPDKIQGEIQTYRQRAEDAEKDYNKKILKRDQTDWLKEKLDDYGVASPYARKQLIAEITDEDNGLKWKDGAFMGLDDFMKAAKEKDANLYQTAEEKEAAEKAAAEAAKAPKFTVPIGKPTPAGDKFVPPKIF